MSGSVTGYNFIKQKCIPARLSLGSTRMHVEFHDLDTGVICEFYEFVSGESCFMIENKEQPFTRLGDSGAVIFEKCDGEDSMLAIGIVTGVQIMNNKFSATFVSPLDAALDKMSRKLSKNLQIVSNYE